MNQEDKDFMEANINNYHTIQNGYLRNLDIHLMNRYEAIYRSNLDANFLLTKWCAACVMDCLTRLYNHYVSLPQEEIQDLPKTDLTNIVKPKRGRPRR
jgi:hypothetical protein